MTEELTYRKFTEKDLVRISEFRKSYFSYNSSIRSYEPEYYGWKCYHNPFLQGEMWLAEDGDIIVGIRNITPKRMKVLGTLVNAAESGDNFTHPDYQRRGISFKLMMSARESMLEKGVSLIYGIPGRITSLPGYIVDFLTLEDDPGIFKKLLLAALEEFHQNKVSMVDTWVVKGGFYDKIFLKFGFLPYSKKTFICYQNELGNRIASSNYKWHFTMGDSDNI